MTNLHEISGRLRVIIFHLLDCKANPDYFLRLYFVDNSFRITCIQISQPNLEADS